MNWNEKNKELKDMKTLMLKMQQYVKYMGMKTVPLESEDYVKMYYYLCKCYRLLATKRGT